MLKKKDTVSRTQYNKRNRYIYLHPKQEQHRVHAHMQLIYAHADLLSTWKGLSKYVTVQLSVTLRSGFYAFYSRCLEFEERSNVKSQRLQGLEKRSPLQCDSCGCRLGGSPSPFTTT